jgi:hypothetical protein
MILGEKTIRINTYFKQPINKLLCGFAPLTWGISDGRFSSPSLFLRAFMVISYGLHNMS